MATTNTTAADLAARRCAACDANTPAMTDAQVDERLRALPRWSREGQRIARAFAFKDYYQTIAFVNAVAWVSHREDHHPDLEVGYNRCVVRYWTHSVGGLSENDFTCAAKVDALEDA